jgi:WhiB family redox-sensing transcriptional regulator
MSAQPSKFRPRLSPPQISDLKVMLIEGVPRQEIADAFGVDVSTVQYHAYRAGMVTPRGETPALPPAKREPAPQSAGRLFAPPPPWMLEALCAQTDPDEFFPDKGEDSEPAKAVCRTCPVTAECLNYALANNEQFGVWGATTPRQRRKLRGLLAVPEQVTTSGDPCAPRRLGPWTLSAPTATTERTSA